MPPKTYFEELSYALRRRELLPRPLEEDGLLPVEWNGRILCRVTESGAVRYDPTWVDTSRAKAALAQVTEAAGTVMEYMTLLENAPPLKADGLADGYRVLAEFNGTVLAGTETLLGAQFVTWARDYDRSGVNNGHYYMEDYQGAREDFALRSGLVARERVFDREQLEEQLNRAGYKLRSLELLQVLAMDARNRGDKAKCEAWLARMRQESGKTAFRKWAAEWNA